MQKYAILSLKVGGWFSLISILMFICYSSDSVPVILAWVSDDTFFALGLIAIPLALISFIPAIWYGVLLTISYSIKFVREQSKL